MPNNNATRKAERRAKLAAAKAARNAAGVNMFTPLNGTNAVVGVKSVEPGSSPLGANALYYTTDLREANLFRGKPYRGTLSIRDTKQMQMAGLPVKVPLFLGSEQAVVNEIDAENHTNTMATKSASSPNNEANVTSLPLGWYEAKDKNGNPYYYSMANSTPQWERPTLPSGWYTAKNRNGNPYYYSMANSTPQWERPTLPSGWYEAKDGNGNPYYFKADGTVQWNKPSRGGRSRKRKHKNSRRH
jgi:hypothetical protein